MLCVVLCECCFFCVVGCLSLGVPCSLCVVCLFFVGCCVCAVLMVVLRLKSKHGCCWLFVACCFLFVECMIFRCVLFG